MMLDAYMNVHRQKSDSDRSILNSEITDDCSASPLVCFQGKKTTCCLHGLETLNCQAPWTTADNSNGVLGYLRDQWSLYESKPRDVRN